MEFDKLKAYINKELPASEQAKIDLERQNDPFLDDALKGYEHMPNGISGFEKRFSKARYGKMHSFSKFRNWYLGAFASIATAIVVMVSWNLLKENQTAYENRSSITAIVYSDKTIKKNKTNSHREINEETNQRGSQVKVKATEVIVDQKKPDGPANLTLKPVTEEKPISNVSKTGVKTEASTNSKNNVDNIEVENLAKNTLGEQNKYIGVEVGGAIKRVKTPNSQLVDFAPFLSFTENYVQLEYVQSLNKTTSKRNRHLVKNEERLTQLMKTIGEIRNHNWDKAQVINNKLKKEKSVNPELTKWINTLILIGKHDKAGAEELIETLSKNETRIGQQARRLHLELQQTDDRFDLAGYIKNTEEIIAQNNYWNDTEDLMFDRAIVKLKNHLWQDARSSINISVSPSPYRKEMTKWITAMSFVGEGDYLKGKEQLNDLKNKESHLGKQAQKLLKELESE